MIDIHCHILPEVDDGAKSMEDAIAMAKQAYEDGVRTIVNTSHFYDLSTFVTGHPLQEKWKQFQETLKSEGIDIQVLLGNEAFITPELPSYVAKQDIFSLNQSRYLLVELPMNDFPTYVDQVFYELMLMGITPILAHPERYGKVAEQPNIVYDLVKKGVLVQVNGGSLTGRFGEEVKKTSQLFLAHNLVHFLGSDGHSPRGRKPTLSKAVKAASEIIGHEQAEKLVTAHSLAVIENKEFFAEEPIEIKKKISFFMGLFHKIKGKKDQDIRGGIA